MRFHSLQQLLKLVRNTIKTTATAAAGNYEVATLPKQYGGKLFVRVIQNGMAIYSMTL